MKRYLIAAAFAATTFQAAAAASCDPANYTVKPISFESTPFEIAAIRLVGGTPFVVSLNKPTPALVTAKGIEGRLDAVLNALTAKFNASWNVVDCSIRFVGLPEAAPAPAPTPAAAPVAKKWTFRAGEMLQPVLTRWAESEGWHLSWEMEVGVDYEFPFNQTLEGELERVVDLLIFGINRNGRQVAATFYEGNRVLRVYPRRTVASELTEAQ